MSQAKSTSDLPSKTASTPPHHGRRSASSVSGGMAGRRSTAGSTSSLSSSQNLSVMTTPTLKSPYDGVKIAPWARLDEGLAKTVEQLGSEDWEVNVNGLTSILRLIRFNQETVIVEYKELMELVLKQVKNLRSQVARAAVWVVGDMFIHLKRNMESELEKVVLPILHKTGDTNKFLREDCNFALDRMVENISPQRSIAVLTGEILHHKSPIIRTTISRLLTLVTDKIGAAKALSGGKDLTEKLLPAVAKLAQDGALEARIYAKMNLKMLMENPEFERILKKNVTANTMRNLEKILDQVAGGVSSKAISRGTTSRHARSSRKTF